MWSYLFGESSVGSRIVDGINTLQNNGKYLWLRKIGLVGEVSGFVWMYLFNLLLYGTIFSIVFAL